MINCDIMFIDVDKVLTSIKSCIIIILGGIEKMDEIPLYC